MEDVPRSILRSIEVEELIRNRGPMSIEQIKRILGFSRSSVAIAIRESEFLVLENGLVKLAEVVPSEYGETTEKELRKLRKYNWPTPQEIQRRAREIRRRKGICNTDSEKDD